MKTKAKGEARIHVTLAARCQTLYPTATLGKAVELRLYTSGSRLLHESWELILQRSLWCGWAYIAGSNHSVVFIINWW